MTETEPLEILIVEDDPNDVELSLRAFKKHNLANHVQVARDGAEALDFVFGQGAFASRETRDHPKVVFLDLKLPKVSGLEVLRRLKADERTKAIPVVILTSSREDRDMAESYQLGVNSYITKPIAFDELVKVVAELGLYWLLLNKVPGRAPAP